MIKPCWSELETCPVCGGVLRVVPGGRAGLAPCSRCRGEFAAGERRPEWPRVRSAAATACGELGDRRAVLLAEHRDEVFARVAADLAEAGWAVVRAADARQGVRAAVAAVLAGAVVNLDAPHGGGWTLAAKTRLAQPDGPLWLYKAQARPRERRAAEMLGAEALLEHGGDLWRLADSLTERLRRFRGEASGRSGPPGARVG